MFNVKHASISEYEDANYCLDISNLGEVIGKYACHMSIELIKWHVPTTDAFSSNFPIHMFFKNI